MFVVWLFLAMSWVCLQFVTVVFPDHIHLLFFLLRRSDDSTKKYLVEPFERLYFTPLHDQSVCTEILIFVQLNHIFCQNL